MTDTKAIKYEQEIPDVLASMAETHQVMDAHGFDRTIHHLVQLRASQINHCGFCVKMHTKEARQDGETSERLDRLVVWDQVSDFTERERAALAWTEALTVLGPEIDLGALRARLKAHFTGEEIGVLTATVAMINLWNRINISRH
ncbi:MAG: carboxymuconolactone decarboxylase family protein [Alphaproteobacteria bacterium]|nr:carboxymuconolactone decarboxylase family protein [Alphaproteobacteria bacterium]